MTLALWMTPARAYDVPGVSARSFVLMDAGTGTILAERNADTQMLVASTTKILTAALVIVHVDDLDEVVTILPEAVGIEGSSMYLRAGEEIAVRDLLYGLMLASGNDAAVALAYHVAGGIPEFADLMNEKAAELLMEHSHFSNPHGLDAEDHVSTAGDMAKLTAWAMELTDFVQIASTRQVQAAGRSLVNHNKLLWRYPGTLGVKTGYTKASGRSLVSAAERDGTMLICVTLSAPDDWDDHAALYDWGFARFKYHAPIVAGDVFATVPVIAGTQEQVDLISEMSLSLLVSPDDVVTVEAYVPRFVYAEVRTGEQAGLVRVLVNGETVLETRLLFGETVLLDEANRLGFLEELRWRFDRMGR